MLQVTRDLSSVKRETKRNNLILQKIAVFQVLLNLKLISMSFLFAFQIRALFV